jgi:hypothetical protein
MTLCKFTIPMFMRHLARCPSIRVQNESASFVKPRRLTFTTRIIHGF